MFIEPIDKILSREVIDKYTLRGYIMTMKLKSRHKE